MMALGTGRGWRRLTGRRLLMLLSLAAIVVASVSVTVFVIRPAAATTDPIPSAIRQADPRAAGAYFQLRHYGKKRASADARAKALAQATKLPRFQVKNPRVKASTKGAHNASAAADTITTSAWTPLGPAPIGTGNTASTGRVTALAVDPTDADVIWVGTADGGVWRSQDGGTTYTPLGDTWEVLSVGSIAIDPENHNTVYVGTGEGNVNGDAYWGVGIYKTTNGDQATPTWTQLGFDKFGGLSVTKVAVNPTNSTDILAAVTWSGATSGGANPPGGGTTAANGGIWQSTDSGSNWTQVLKGNSTPNYDYGTDVVFDPNPADSQVVYAGLANVLGEPVGNFSGSSQAGIYWSTDGGTSWRQYNLQLSKLGSTITNADLERVSLGISNDGTALYAMLTDGDVRDANQPNFGKALAGKIFIINTPNTTPMINEVSLPAAMASDSSAQQWWYNSTVGVDQNTPGTAYVGGQDLWKVTNGTSPTPTFTDITSGGIVHTDEHAIAFAASSSSPYVGTDGGIWQYNGTSFTNKNGIGAGTLNITPFYGGSYGDAGSSARLYGGAQSNGELQYQGDTSLSELTSWAEKYGGTGGYTAVDYTNNAIVYEEDVFGLIHKSTNGGGSWATATSGIDLSTANFIMPFIMSPNNHNTLFAGTNRVYRTTNAAGSWTAISPQFGQAISALAVAPGNDNVIYAGTNGGFFYSTIDGGAHWSTGLIVPGSTGANSGGGVLTGLAVDPQNSATVYATYSAFASGSGGHVFRSIDNGQHWTDIDGTLPNIPFESVLVPSGNGSMVIAGSDAGVFISEDHGSTWSQLGTGLPNVAIDQLFASHDGGKLFVATHGRGMWVLDTPALQVTSTGLLPISATVAVGGTFSQTLTVKNIGVGSTPMNWSLDTTNKPACLTLSKTSGALTAGSTDSVTVTVDTSASVACTYTLNFSADGINATLSIPLSVGVENLSKTWYFAEGYTASGFTTWLTLTNPGNVVAPVTITYLIQGSSKPVVKTLNVPANHRSTINVNDAVGTGKSVATVITSTQPIIAERPMYVNSKVGSTAVYGGHSLLGATSLTQDFYLSYLDTTATHLTWLTALNRESTAMTMTVTYYPKAGGTPIVRHHTIAAQSRGSFQVNNDVPAGAPNDTYSAYIHLSVPGMLERPMYLKDAATGRVGVTDIPGVAAPQTAWYFAEGQSDSNYNETYILSNQTGSDAHVHLMFYNSDGTDPSFDYTIPAGQQRIVPVNSLAGVAAQHGAAVTSDDQAILAERYDSLKYIGPTGLNRATTTITGTTDGSGTATLGQAFYFAEGFTGGSSNELLELANPASAQTATVYVSYIPSTGGAATIISYSVPAHSRLTIDVGAVLPGTSLSLQVLSDQPIAAERTLVFMFGVTGGGTRPGADVAAGYQP